MDVYGQRVSDPLKEATRELDKTDLIIHKSMLDADQAVELGLEIDYALSYENHDQETDTTGTCSSCCAEARTDFGRDTSDRAWTRDIVSQDRWIPSLRLPSLPYVHPQRLQ